jgi:hypothetical protein
MIENNNEVSKAKSTSGLEKALQTRECQQAISKIKSENRINNTPNGVIQNAENESGGDTE